MNGSCGEPITVRFVDLHRDCIELTVTIFGYIIPILSFFVTTMNVLVIMVFIKPHMRSHTTFILTLIACVDTLNIACPAIVFAYHYLSGNYKEFLTCGQIKWAYVFGEISVDMLNMLSLWLTVLLAFIRCKCIKSPFIARRVHSSSKILIYVMIILVIVCFVHVPSFFIFDFTSVKTVDRSNNLTKVIGALVELEGVYLKSCSGRKVHIFMETISDSILPCAVLLVCNIKILITLRKAKESRSSLRRNDTVRITGNEKNSHDCTQSESVLRKEFNYDSDNTNLGVEKVLNADEKCKTTFSKQLSQDSSCKSVSLKSHVKDEHPNYSVSKCTKLHGFCTSQTRHVRASISSDATLDKLDRESERTSWLILLVSTFIVIHEFPLAGLNIYNLAKYTDKPLPLSHGCISVILLLWQFMTYPAIFIIYACMSKAFRAELRKIFTCLCKRHPSRLTNKRKSFISPCSVRKRLPRHDYTHPRSSHGNDSDSDKDFDRGNGSGKIQDLETNTLGDK